MLALLSRRKLAFHNHAEHHVAISNGDLASLYQPWFASCTQCWKGSLVAQAPRQCCNASAGVQGACPSGRGQVRQRDALATAAMLVMESKMPVPVAGGGIGCMHPIDLSTTMLASYSTKCQDNMIPPQQFLSEGDPMDIDQNEGMDQKTIHDHHNKLTGSL
uniref:Uncharacterized protein n=1 Tax=Arundo donax TaxID=35708 RepID=A0A0A9CV04_ARUDO